MVKKAYDEKYMKIAEYILILYAWALCICYQVIFAKFVLQLLNDELGFNFYEDRSNEVYNLTGITIII
jgi:hypothetical protein